ncbi:uncharacterized protein HD556DRAFT_1450960 [Suillus plorans]|uniref:Uncharacterized protein n=1 Tax=Suillus plorans TaxID=116603 RepID=A0A9P7A9Y1_9AGAM|nr:uncharacterized protein HD556DRAFT_1450960 [Suillus plorans]KAG1785209.1 hypothetical protein HD556DRAFT_1450960 [Suillus plorans]
MLSYVSSSCPQSQSAAIDATALALPPCSSLTPLSLKDHETFLLLQPSHRSQKIWTAELDRAQLERKMVSLNVWHDLPIFRGRVNPAAADWIERWAIDDPSPLLAVLPAEAETSLASDGDALTPFAIMSVAMDAFAQAAPPVVEVEADTQLALWDAQQAARCMHPLSGPAITVASVGQDTQADLDAADGYQDAYLEPLRIFDAVIGEIVHPYAKMALGALSCTAKDQAVKATEAHALEAEVARLCMMKEALHGEIKTLRTGSESSERYIYFSPFLPLQPPPTGILSVYFSYTYVYTYQQRQISNIAL